MSWGPLRGFVICGSWRSLGEPAFGLHKCLEFSRSSAFGQTTDGGNQVAGLGI